MSVTEMITDWLPVAFGAVMILAGIANFFGSRSVRESFARWGYPPGFHRVTGGVEVVAGALLLFTATARAGAIVSFVVMLAAATTLIRHREWSHLPGAIVLAVAALAVMILG